MNRTKRTARSVTALVVVFALLWAVAGVWAVLVAGLFLGGAVTVGVLLSGVGEQQRQREAWVAAGSKSTNRGKVAA